MRSYSPPGRTVIEDPPPKGSEPRWRKAVEATPPPRWRAAIEGKEGGRRNKARPAAADCTAPTCATFRRCRGLSRDDGWVDIAGPVPDRQKDGKGADSRRGLDRAQARARGTRTTGTAIATSSSSSSRGAVRSTPTTGESPSREGRRPSIRRAAAGTVFNKHVRRGNVVLVWGMDGRRARSKPRAYEIHPDHKTQPLSPASVPRVCASAAATPLARETQRRASQCVTVRLGLVAGRERQQRLIGVDPARRPNWSSRPRRSQIPCGPQSGSPGPHSGREDGIAFEQKKRREGPAHMGGGDRGFRW